MAAAFRIARSSCCSPRRDTHLGGLAALLVKGAYQGPLGVNIHQRSVHSIVKRRQRSSGSTMDAGRPPWTQGN